MSTPTAPADLLREAAHLLETRGWCRGRFESRSGHFCAVGALRYAASGASDSSSQSVRDAVDALKDDLGIPVVRWNDDQRDRRKVVRQLRRTADRLSAGAAQ